MKEEYSQYILSGAEPAQNPQDRRKNRVTKGRPAPESECLRLGGRGEQRFEGRVFTVYSVRG